MAHHIPSNLDHSNWPSQLNVHQHPHYVEILKDKVTAVYRAKGSHADPGAVQTDVAAPTNCSIYYFEVFVQCEGLPTVTIGLSGKNTLLNRPPGIDCSSVGYRAKDGRKLCGNKEVDYFGLPYGNNDIIGCGIDYSDNSIFYTNNGSLIGTARQAHAIDYYPTVSMSTVGEKIKFNFSGPFLFDLPKAILNATKDEKQKIREQCSMSDFSLFLLVRNHLLFRGYQKTLAALDEFSEFKQQHFQEMELEKVCPEDQKEILHANISNFNDVKESSNAECIVDEDFSKLHTTAKNEIHAQDNSNVDNSKLNEINSVSEVTLESAFSTPMDTKANSVHDFWEETEMSSECIQKMEASLYFRAEMRESILKGEIEKVINQLTLQNPNFLENDLSLSTALLYSQHLIELLRYNSNNIQEALLWIRSKFNHFKTAEGHIFQPISEVTALIAYKNFGLCPLQHYFDQSRRILLFDKLNEHLLSTQHRCPTWSPLHVLVRHLICCKELLREKNANRGPVPTCRSVCRPHFM